MIALRPSCHATWHTPCACTRTTHISSGLCSFASRHVVWSSDDFAEKLGAASALARLQSDEGVCLGGLKKDVDRLRERAFWGPEQVSTTSTESARRVSGLLVVYGFHIHPSGYNSSQLSALKRLPCMPLFAIPENSHCRCCLPKLRDRKMSYDHCDRCRWFPGQARADGFNSILPAEHLLRSHEIYVCFGTRRPSVSARVYRGKKKRSKETEQIALVQKLIMVRGVPMLGRDESGPDPSACRWETDSHLDVRIRCTVAIMKIYDYWPAFSDRTLSR
jgi:hypothetical protein